MRGEVGPEGDSTTAGSVAACNNAKHVLEARNLYKTYGKNTVLRDVSVGISEREVVSIIGASGSGKSTLLRCLNRLEMPCSGEVLFEGQSILPRRTNINKVRAQIGFVFQVFNLYTHLTALQNASLALWRVKKLSRKRAKEAAAVYLERVGLADRMDHYPSQLSGGQQQRVGIARALAMEPKVILFDEPTSALDPELVMEVLDVIAALQDQGYAMMIVTHEMRFARRVSSRIVYMDLGSVVAEGSPEYILDDCGHERLKSFMKSFRE